MNRIGSRARGLRNTPTYVEALLWRQLRMWQLDGYKFRRQQLIGNYIVDFACLEKKLIVEIDGGQHAERGDYDTLRDRWLRIQGFTILRFWNNEVVENIASVIERIYDIEKHPLPSSFPARGKDRDRREETSGERPQT